MFLSTVCFLNFVLNTIITFLFTFFLFAHALQLPEPGELGAEDVFGNAPESVEITTPVLRDLGELGAEDVFGNALEYVEVTTAVETYGVPYSDNVFLFFFM